MGLSLVLNRFVVGHPHVAGTVVVVVVADARHVAHTVGAVGTLCTNYFVRFDVVDAAVAVAVAVAAIVVATPTADDSSRSKCPVDCCYFALRRIGVDPSKVVATNKEYNGLDFTTGRQSINHFNSVIAKSFD